MLRNLLVLTLGIMIVFVSNPALAQDKAAQHFKDLSCAVNEIAKFNGIKWKCSLDEDTGDTLGDLSCDTSQIAEYDGSQWVCSDKGDSGPPAGPPISKADLYFKFCPINGVDGNTFVGKFCPCDDEQDIPIASLCAGALESSSLVQSGTILTENGMGLEGTGGASCLWNKNSNITTQFNARVWCLDVNGDHVP
jgi:hypothetical protein